MCQYDTTTGIYDWSCMDCRARWYLAQPERMRGGIAKAWRQSMPAKELAEVKRLIAERAEACSTS